MHAPTTDHLEIRRLTPGLRAFTVGVWGACAALFASLAVRYPTNGHSIGWVLSAVCAWSALYWLRVPALCAIVRGNGVSYVDGRLGWFLAFRWRHAAWTDIVAVDTREITNRSGSYVRTRVTVRDDAGAGTRTFTVTSQDAGYGPFIDVMAALTSGLPIETRGLGVQAVGVRRAIHRIRAGRLRVLGAFALLSAALLVVSFFARR